MNIYILCIILYVWIHIYIYILYLAVYARWREYSLAGFFVIAAHPEYFQHRQLTMPQCAAGRPLFLWGEDCGDFGSFWRTRQGSRVDQTDRRTSDYNHAVCFDGMFWMVLHASLFGSTPLFDQKSREDFGRPKNPPRMWEEPVRTGATVTAVRSDSQVPILEWCNRAICCAWASWQQLEPNPSLLQVLLVALVSILKLRIWESCSSVPSCKVSR
jgi:hypothetical protein